ncbi:Rossmann-like and DUF2520 domain-containing protein [Sphingobium sp. CCH11-B1]|jgi:predicted short-subunit dehydrogenase-like oxidoreductase (DUF2520 family)|uniref:Rossmann-like and DUF2520 domain-containing protein n=1 Tax=Sphingobium sp. CCH11-B1 TaxID=1768781 RepID=UPI000834400A|nr:DUF2520 domain-containing protein [Sphingobium sp. CCH11-B1]MEA3390328.1 DUF2520 domain-containing protein [Pseudomonadota bacterium]
MAEKRRVGVIGSGRVAQAMALGLARMSAGPPMLWGRNAARAEAAAARLGGVEVAPGLDALAQRCGLILLAVSDDGVGAVAEALAAHVRPGCFAFHGSGRSGAAILSPLAKRGALTAAIHPAMTFTGDPAGEVARMAGARFAVTCADDAMDIALAVVAGLDGVAVPVAEAQRTLYHAALCHAANHLVTLIAGAGEALALAGVAEPGALMAPLVRAALDNGLERGIAGLSGPLLRGDRATIADHLAAMARDCPDLLPPYRAMARATLREQERTGAPASPQMRALLEE